MPGHTKTLHALPLSFFCATTAWANCDNYYVGDNLYYLGRTSNQSVWVSNTQALGNYSLNAPGVADIDTWTSTSNPELRLSLSPVVDSSLNGNHQLQILGVSGDPSRPNCFVASRSQVNPIIPPTWRPPQKPDLPVIPARPELPDRPVVARPSLPNRPVVIRPVVPANRPISSSRPQQPELPELRSSSALTQAEIASLCPSAERDAEGQYTAETLQRCPALKLALEQAPLTPGRDLPDESLWNAWIDPHYTYTSNRRGFSDVEEKTRSLGVGVDRRINPDLAIGVLMSVSDLETETFNGNLTTDGTSYNLGPYLAYQLSPAWSLFANATVGTASMEREVLMFKGEGDSSSYGGNVNLYGDFPLTAQTHLRPKLGINYQKEDIEDFTLKGRIASFNLAPEIEGARQESGQVLATLELNTLFVGSGNHVYRPYVEVGTYYNYLQDKQSTYPEWQGVFRGGLRALLGNHTQIDASLSYDSVGVSGLDVWDIGLFISHGF